MKLKRTIIGFLTATMLATAIAVPAAPQKAQAAAKKAYADSTLIMRTLPKKSSKKVKKLRIGNHIRLHQLFRYILVFFLCFFQCFKHL